MPGDGVDVDQLHRKARRQRRQAEADLSPDERVTRAYRLFCLWRGTPEGIEEADPVQELTDVVDQLAEQLETRGVPFVIGGAFALAAQGNPRFTYNLDIMVLTDVDRAAAALDVPRFEELSPVSYRETTTDLLVDIHPVRDGAQQWAARQAETLEIAGRDVQVLTPEGLAVMLLREATEGEDQARPLRLRDLELLARQPGLDWETVAEQVRRYGYEEAYEEIGAGDKPTLASEG